VLEFNIFSNETSRNRVWRSSVQQLGGGGPNSAGSQQSELVAGLARHEQCQPELSPATAEVGMSDFLGKLTMPTYDD
jgi:hypothetical protein